MADDRHPHLLAMARKHGCSFRWLRGCRGDETSTTVAAHDNTLASGKGLGLKAADWSIVYACFVCHSAFDQGMWSASVKREAYRRALERQQMLYREILATPTSRLKDREAARWALEHLNANRRTCD